MFFLQKRILFKKEIVNVLYKSTFLVILFNPDLPDYLGHLPDSWKHVFYRKRNLYSSRAILSYSLSYLHLGWGHYGRVECSLFGSVRNRPARQAPNYTSFSPVRKAFYVLPFQDYANVPMRFIQKTQYIIRIATIVFNPQKHMLHLFNLAKQP